MITKEIGPMVRSALPSQLQVCGFDLGIPSKGIWEYMGII